MPTHLAGQLDLRRWSWRVLFVAVLICTHRWCGAADPPAAPTASVAGRLIVPTGTKAGGRQITVSIRLPTEAEVDAVTQDDGSFLLSGIAAGASGTIGFPNLRDLAHHVEWQEEPDGFTVHRDYIEFKHVSAGENQGVEVYYAKVASATGVVTDELGKPVAGVYVEPMPKGQPDGNAIFKTDSAGRYKAKLPPDEQICLKVLGQGKVEDEQSEWFAVKPEESIQRNLSVKRIVHLTHTNVITGRVIDAQGNAVASAKVMLGNHTVLPEEIVNGVMSDSKTAKPTWKGGLFWVAETATAADGSFTFDMLQPGKTDVWAFDPKVGWAWAREVATDAHDVKLTLSPQPVTIDLGGIIADEHDQGVANVRILALDEENTEFELLKEGRSGDGGKFDLNVTPREIALPHVKLFWVAPDGRFGWRLLPRMSIGDLHLRLKPASSISGRVVDRAKLPVAGSIVRPSLADDADFGKLFFRAPLDQIAELSATTDAEGRFTLVGPPVGSTLSLTVRHPEHGRGEMWYARNLKPQQTIDDIALPDNIVLEGTVRSKDSGQPLSGVTVMFGDWGKNRPTTVSDAQGHYRFTGLDRMLSDFEQTIVATVGSPEPSLEGSIVCKTRLQPGDHLSGIDIVVAKSFAARQKEWLAHPGKAAVGQSMVAVLDDADPAYSGRAEYGDTFSLRDTTGAVKWQVGKLNVSQSVAGEKKIDVDPHDRSLVMVENNGRRILKFSATGEQLWVKNNVEGGSVAVDPVTSDVWILTSDGTIYGNGLLVLDSAGKELHRWPIKGHTLAYSKADDCFWVIGQGLQSVTRDGKVKVKSPVTFAWLGCVVAVNQQDGTVWAAEGHHPQVEGSQGRIFILNRDGQVRKSLDIEAACIAIDEQRGAVWVGGYERVQKLDLEGKLIAELPLHALSISIEPDTGYVWTTFEGINRLDTDGWPVWRSADKTNSDCWAFILPPGI